MTIKMLVCDIDGTLIPYSRESISDKLKETFDEAKAKGIHILIATGRHYSFIHKSLFEDVNPDYFVTINGACLVDKHGTVLESYPMKEEDVDILYKLCEEYNIGLGFKFKEGVVIYSNYDKFYKGYVGDKDYGNAVFANPTDIPFHKTNGLPLGAFLIGDETIIETFKEKIPSLVFAWSYSKGYDAYPPTFSKATTIASVLKMNNLTWDNVMSFGDAENDIEMLRQAQIGVAMGNARDIVKKEADFVTTSVDEDGVDFAIRHFNVI
ncbi:MAG: HAD family hydrolase [Anaerorhabdus sp.]|uniref:HAD family hydrolase n=1 Tax=Anaerorhabdus sp. TaxID=1872524 RepID=UPI003A855B0E